MTDPVLKPWEKRAAAVSGAPAGKPWEKRAVKSGATESPAMSEGLASLSGMTPSPTIKAAYDASMAQSNAANAPTPFESFAGSLAPGVSFGFADEIAGGIDAALTDRTYDQSVEMLRARDRQLAETNPKSAMAGQIVGAVASPAGAAFVPAKGATLGVNIGRGALAGGAAGAVYGYGTGEGGITPRMENALRGGVGGAVIGGAIPAVGAMARKGIEKLAAPNAGADPVRLGLAKVLEDFGVPLTAGQKVGSEALMRKEGLTAGGQRMMSEQQEAFTTAALKTAGIDAKRATPEVLDDAALRIGKVFDDVTQGVDVAPDATALTALADAVSTYKSLAPTGSQAPLVSEVLKASSTAMRGGNTISAKTVNTWRSGLSKLTTSNDAATREAARAALEAVDDMLTGSLTAAGRADDVARLATARGEWRNFLAIQKAAVREGDGLLSPARLRATVIGQGEGAFARGKRGDIGALARAGGEVMAALPNSGTPAGIRAMIPGGSLPAVIGAGLGAGGGPLGAAAGAAAGLVLPKVTGAIRMSGPVQNYLAGQGSMPWVESLVSRGGMGALPQAAVPVGNILAGR